MNYALCIVSKLLRFQGGEDHVAAVHDENGAGLVLRKKMDKFSELFIFKNTKKNAPMPQRQQPNGFQQMRRNEPSASEEPKPAAIKKEEEQNEAEKK